MTAIDGSATLVLGADSAVGRAIAERVVAEGGRVFLAASTFEPVGELIARLGHNQADGRGGALSDGEEIERLLQAGRRRFGRIHRAIADVRTAGDRELFERFLAVAARTSVCQQVIAVLHSCDHAQAGSLLDGLDNEVISIDLLLVEGGADAVAEITDAAVAIAGRDAQVGARVVEVA